ncbi:MAG TPA: SDR family NAD(P)-dependent oxidoreductase, partial [Usitatibacter sp.]|nr:SDR family NAD(P)-dependent oxidoreductase [Usitatibacter sp.]
MKLDVRNKRIVVAGGSRGIGRSIALAFAESGAAVSICARGVEALEATRKELAAKGGTVHAAKCDLSSEADIARYIPEAAKALGGIDVLVNNATAGAVGDAEEAWDESLAVDLRAVVRASRAALPYLEKGREPTII